MGTTTVGKSLEGRVLPQGDLDHHSCVRENSKSLGKDKVWVREKLPGRVSEEPIAEERRWTGTLQEHQEKVNFLQRPQVLWESGSCEWESQSQI